MKLKELVDDIFKDGPVKPYETMGFNTPNYTLYGEKDLLKYKEKLLLCDEFSEVEELHFMSMPFITIDDQPKNASSFKHSDGVKLKGKCYLLSLSYSPEMFDPSTFNKPVKDGAGITPIVYDPSTFEPKRSILLSFSPERKQEFPPSEFNGEELVRQELHELLDKVLDNPEDYRVKGVRGILIRGIFENVESPSVPPPQLLSGVINKQDTNPTHHLVFYMDKQETESGIKVELKNKMIPSELKEKFLSEFKDEGIHITEEQINQFLERNNITK
jgi:hypothetical protein